MKESKRYQIENDSIEDKLTQKMKNIISNASNNLYEAGTPF